MEEFSAPNPSRSADAIPAVPQSTAEVSIRTLASDLDMIGKSGGMPTAHIERVAVDPEPVRSVGPTGVEVPHTPVQVRDGGRIMIMTIAAIVIAAVLFALGFYLAPIFG